MKRTVFLLWLALGLSFAGCSKSNDTDSEAEQSEENSAEEEAAAENSGENQGTTEPEPESNEPEEFAAAETLEDAPVEGMGLTVDRPSNLEVSIADGTATLTAGGGFYPVTISKEAVTLENARFKITVNGVETLANGTTWDGRTRIIQTACHLVSCEVDHPNPYRSDIAEVGRAVCDSIEVSPYPTQGALRQVRDASRSFSGQCSDEDRALAEGYGAIVRQDAIQEAAVACWREAAAANAEWAGVDPRLSVTWGVRPAEDWDFETRISGLEGDTASLQTCFDAAMEGVRSQLDASARTSEGCHLASLMATYDMIHEIVCPGDAPAAPE